MKDDIHSAYDLKSFVKTVLFIDLVTLIVSLYPVYRIWGLNALIGVFAGDVLTTLNILAGYYFLSRYFEAPYQTFLKMVFGSMTVRLILMLAFVVGIILLLKLDQNSFIISLFISYIYKSVIEIIFINKKSRETSFSTNSGDDTES